MEQWNIADEIVQNNNPALRMKAEPIAKNQIGSLELKKLILHMRTLLAQEKNGVGLAASQVGVPIALFIVAGEVFEEKDEEKGGKVLKEKKRKRKEDEKNQGPHPLDKIFINPELVRSSRKKEERSEGCLSVRGKYGTVLRHEKASIKALDEHGKPTTYHAAGLLAHIFQHEMDHLSGVLFTDKAISIEDKNNRQIHKGSNVKLKMEPT